MDCIFCKIAHKEIPSHLIYEDANAVGILDIHPRTPGHVLVLPKVHVASIVGVPSEDVGGTFLAVKNITALLEEKLKPDGFTIGINHGEVAGQEVPHLHIHIMPRWRDDGGGCIQSIVQYQKESVEEIKKKILS
jgi:histidine triad (HIT) family protein